MKITALIIAAIAAAPSCVAFAPSSQIKIASEKATFNPTKFSPLYMSDDVSLSSNFQRYMTHLEL